MRFHYFDKIVSRWLHNLHKEAYVVFSLLCDVGFQYLDSSIY